MLDTVETSGSVLMISNEGRTVCAVVCMRARHHAVDHVVVHQHGAEIRDVVDGLAGLLDGDALVLAQLGVLLGELVAQLAGLRVEHRRRRQVDTQFGGAGPDLGLLAEDRQVGDAALQQPPGGLEDAVVVAFGQHDVLAVRAGPVQQLVGEHLRRDHRRDRNRQLRQQVRGVDVGVHQRQRGVDLALRGGGDPAPRRRHPAGGLERAVAWWRRSAAAGPVRKPARRSTGAAPGRR